jgi:hypothetical protein
MGSVVLACCLLVVPSVLLTGKSPAVSAPLTPNQDDCAWHQEVWIEGRYAGSPEDGPFTVSHGSAISFAHALSCSFEYDWSLYKAWEPALITLLTDMVTTTDGWWDYNEMGWLEWYGDLVLTDTVVNMQTAFQMTGRGRHAITIDQFVDFGLLAWHRPVVLYPMEHAYLPLVVRGP